MVIRYSNQLLEQLSDIEEKIKLFENIMEEMEIDCDREALIKSLLTKRFKLPSGPQS